LKKSCQYRCFFPVGESSMTPGGMLWNDKVLFTHTVTSTSSPATT